MSVNPVKSLQVLEKQHHTALLALSHKSNRHHGRRTPPQTRGAARSGRTLVVVLRNSNRRTHSLETGRPLLFAGPNSHLRAACKASRAKYLLGPGESSVASVTAPEGSTRTLTPTCNVP